MSALVSALLGLSLLSTLTGVFLMAQQGITWLVDQFPERPDSE